MKYAIKPQLVIATPAGAGVLTDVCALLSKHRINIQDIYATEEKDKGLLHLIVDDPDRAEEAMRSEGFIPLRNNVLIFDIKDSPGTLGKICSVFASNGINIEYVYGSENIHPHLMKLVRRMVLIMKVSDIDKAVKILQTKISLFTALVKKAKAANAVKR